MGRLYPRVPPWEGTGRAGQSPPQRRTESHKPGSVIWEFRVPQRPSHPSSQCLKVISKWWGVGSGQPEGRGRLVLQAAQRRTPSCRSVGTQGSSPHPQPLASLPLRGPFSPALASQVASGGAPPRPRMRPKCFLGRAIYGGSGYGGLEFGPMEGDGAPGVLGNVGSLSSWRAVFLGPLRPQQVCLVLGRMGNGLDPFPGLCLLGCPPSPPRPTCV